MRNKLTVFFLLMLSMGLLFGCSNDQEENADGNSDEDKIKIITSFVVDDEHFVGIGAHKFKDLVDERLGDKVEVELHSNASLFEFEEGLEALGAGNIQMVLASTSQLVGYDDAYQLYDMPFLFDSAEHVRVFTETEEGTELWERLENSNIKFLDLWSGAFSQLTNNKHPIESPEDMKGLKFRVMAGGLLADQFSQLGAGATVIPFSDLYMSLQQGVIDGQENPYIEIATNKLYEVQKYMTITDHKLATYPVLTNTDFWNGLPEEIRSELEDILNEVSSSVDETVKEVVEKSYNEIIEYGDLEILELSDDDRQVFMDALEPLYNDYMDIIGEELINKAQSLK